jgi:hypothetical protein
MPQPWADVDHAVGTHVAPLGSYLRHDLPDRWVRFNALPEGERIARTVPQRREALNRYHTVLQALGAPDLVTTCGWAAKPPAARHPDLAELMPAAAWTHVPAERATTVYVTEVGQGAQEALDTLLLEWVADDRTADVIVAPRTFDWLVHPYDGGIDVIAGDDAQRDELRRRFADWLAH